MAAIEIKFGITQIKNIVLAIPKNDVGNEISVNLDGIEQIIEDIKQEVNTITINLKSTCEVVEGSTLTFYMRD